MKVKCLLFCILALLETVHAAKILFVLPLPAKSHYYANQPLIDALVQRKHEIHIVGPAIIKSSIPKTAKFIEIEVSMPHDGMLQDLLKNEAFRGSTEKMRNLVGLAVNNCNDFLSSPNVQQLIKGGVQYDLAIVDMLMGECRASVSHLVAKHSIYYTTGHLTTWNTKSAPSPASYIPETFAPRQSSMTFYERLWNLLDTVGTRLVYQYEMLPGMQKVVEKYVPSALSVYDADQKIHFVLTNVDPVAFSVRPSMPNIINVGGTHCRPGNPLPKDLKQFADKSNGFVIFGMGSVATASSLPDETKKAMLEAFSRLNVDILWKFEEKLPNLPKNVKIIDWMPQQDLLAHPKIRLFITHGGLLSLQEAIYHGVPMVVIPLFAEQFLNAARIKEIGIGEEILTHNINTQNFYDTLSKVLTLPSYTENVKKYSAIFKDQPETPLERAVFWTEYIIRHNGADHLRSPGDELNLIQYYLVDVIGLIVVVLLSVIATIRFIFKAICRILCGSKRSKPSKKKKS